MGAAIGILTLQDTPMTVEPGKPRAIGRVEDELDDRLFGGQPLVDAVECRAQAEPGCSRAENHVRSALGCGDHALGVILDQKVTLVPEFDQASFIGEFHHTEITQHRKDVLALSLGLGMGDVADMDHQVGGAHLFQCGAEGGHQIGRKIRDEADRVRERWPGGRTAG